MRNKYLYRIYRLRRMIVLSTLVGTALFFFAWMIAEQGYQSVLEQKDVLVWSLGFFAVINILQMMIFPKAVGEIFVISCALGLAMASLGVLSNFSGVDVDPFSKQAQHGMIASFIALWLVFYFSISSQYGILFKIKSFGPQTLKREIWLNATPSAVYELFCTKENTTNWSPKIAKIEKIGGTNSQYWVYYNSQMWDAEKALLNPTLERLLTEVLSSEPDVSQSTAIFREDGSLIASHSFVLKADGDGTIYTSIEELTHQRIFTQLTWWFLDHVAEHFYHMKEHFEHPNSISIYAMEHQPYLMQWIAVTLKKLGTDNDSDI